MIVFSAISLLNHITIKDTIGSVKIHNGALIKANANNYRESSYI